MEKEIDYVKYKDINILKSLFDKLSLDGLKDEFIGSVLVVIGNITTEQEKYIGKVKAIQAKAPKELDEYKSNSSKTLSESETIVLNKIANKWNYDFNKAAELLAESNSTIKSSDIHILNSSDILSWINANKKEIKSTDAGFLYKLILK